MQRTRLHPDLQKNIQLLTVKLLKLVHIFSVFLAFMTLKTQAPYNAVFLHLSCLIDALSVLIIMTDFEIVLRNAALCDFLHSHCVGYNVHFDRVIYRKLKSLKLYNSMKGNEEESALMHKIIVLAFLPEQSINGSNNGMKNEALTEVVQNLQSFFNYFERF